MLTSLPSIIGSFCIAIACLLFTSLPLNFFVAPLLLLLYRGSLGRTILAAFLTGLLCDVIQLTPRFGFLGLSYSAACWILYDWKYYFSSDSGVAMFVMAIAFSCLCSLIQGLIALLLELPLGSLSDCVMMAFADACFAWVIFTLLPYLRRLYSYQWRRRRGQE